MADTAQLCFLSLSTLDLVVARTRATPLVPFGGVALHYNAHNAP